MKQIGILSVMAMLLLAVGVSATPFVVDKDVLVTGDWVITDSGWVDKSEWLNPPITATYSFDARSSLATSASYIETEILGTAWEYSLNSRTDANSKGWTQNLFTAVTVNDPVEYPTVLDTKLNDDAYTHYNFNSDSYSEFSASHLSVSGIGYVNVDVKTIFDGAFTQFNQVRVNLNFFWKFYFNFLFCFLL